MPPHQFYQGLALAPVLCFLEPWHFYLPAHREGGANVKISCQEMQCLQCRCCDYALLAVIIWQHFLLYLLLQDRVLLKTLNMQHIILVCKSPQLHLHACCRCRRTCQGFVFPVCSPPLLMRTPDHYSWVEAQVYH